MALLDDLQPTSEGTTYFAFRVPITTHRAMRAILARRGITCQAFFLRVIEDLFQEETQLGGNRIPLATKKATR